MIIDTLGKDTHYFTLDLHKGAILSEPLSFKQYDERSRELAIELTVHDKALNLSNARVDIWVSKQDGHTVVKAAEKENIDLDNSVVVIPLTRQMLVLPPSIECEIVVTYADKKVLSFPIFTVDIERSNVDMETVVSTSEFQLFYEALYRMEEWMRDYLDKYATIDQAFQMKLAALTLALNTVNAEWTTLKTKLENDNRTNFNTFKDEKQTEMNKFYNEYHKFYTEQCKAIQEKLNRLQDDIEELEASVEPILKVITDNSNIISAIKDQCQTLHQQITQIHTDATAKLEEMTTRFTQMNNEFTLAQTDRANKFTASQNERTTAFTNEQTGRETAFTNEQTNRETRFTTEQTNREARFNNEKEVRAEAFRSAEVVRNSKEVERLANEEERKANEADRVAEFNDMKEQFNTFLQYRYITE